MSPKRTSIPASFTPVLVASLTAFSKGSYRGLNATVNAESTIRPGEQVIINPIRVRDPFQFRARNRNHKLTIDVSSKVQLHDIVVLQHGLVSSVGRPVSGNVVERTTRRESDTGFQSLFFNESAHVVLHHLANAGHAHARLDILLNVLANLSVDLGSPTQVIVVIRVKPLEVSLFFASRPPAIAKCKKCR